MSGALQRLRGMSVAWFSFNLATSAIVLSSFALGSLEKTQVLISLAKTLAEINTAVYIAIAIAYIARILLDPHGFARQLRHPVQGPFMSVIAIATMLLSLDWSVVLRNPGVAAAFFYTGLVIHTVIFLLVMYYMERHPGIEVHYMNPGWYMPAVGNVLVPYVGMVLAGEGISVSKSLLGIYLGTGTIMWVALFAIWLYRTIFYHPPPARLMATNWINLAPPAVIPLSYEALLGFTPKVYMKLYHEAARTAAGTVTAKLLVALFDIFYYTFWGTAGLLFLLVLAVTIAYLVRREVEFAESWWAFVFPLAAYTISTIHLYLHHPEDTWLIDMAKLLYALAWLSYIVTTVLSIYYGYAELRGKRVPKEAKPLPEDVIRENNK